MPVDTTHEQYTKAAQDWLIMRNVLEGARAIKEAGELYLPRLGSQEDKDYCAYKNRAQFFNATGRTRESLKGFVFRKDPVFTIPDSMSAFQRDATLTGLSVYDYAKDTVEEVLSVGRRGTLIDFDKLEKRPYIAAYEAENILNWKVERRNGRVLLTMLTLFEYDAEWIPLTKAQEAKTPDQYEQGKYEQWRVYSLDQDGEGNLFCKCQVYRKKQEGKKEPEFVLVKTIVPTRRGFSLNRIPFVFHGPNNGLPDVDKIPLLDMADVNLSLYMSSADLENGRHFAGVPTAWAAGFEPKDGEKLHVGGSTVWCAADPQATCGYLEFTGQGLLTLENAIKEKKGEMAALGAKMLEPEAKKAEAYETVAVRSAAESSALSSIAIACGQTLSRVIQWAAWWSGTNEKPEDLTDTVTIALNTEFTITKLSPQAVAAFGNAYSMGQISFEAFFWNLQQGDAIPPEMTMEEMRGQIEQNPPMSMLLDQKTLEEPVIDPNIDPEADPNKKKAPVKKAGKK